MSLLLLWERRNRRVDRPALAVSGLPSATFRFAVCTETTCDPKIEKLAWNVAVK